MANAFGLAVQSAFGTPNSPATPLDGVTGHVFDPQYTTNIPAFETNSPNQENDVEVTQRAGRVTADGRLTNANSVPLFSSALGTPASGVYLSGGVQKYLTAKEAVSDIAEYWQAQDQLINLLSILYNINSSLTFHAEMLGPTDAYTGSAWSTLAPLPVSYGNWQVMSTIGGVVACVDNLKIDINNNLLPLICSPSALPGVSTPAGLTPSRYARDSKKGVSIRYDLLLRYTGKVGSEYEAFQDQTERTILLQAANRDGTSTLELSLPRCKHTAATRQPGTFTYEHIVGAALFDVSTGAALQATVVG